MIYFMYMKKYVLFLFIFVSLFISVQGVEAATWSTVSDGRVAVVTSLVKDRLSVGETLTEVISGYLFNCFNRWPRGTNTVEFSYSEWNPSLYDDEVIYNDISSEKRINGGDSYVYEWGRESRVVPDFASEDAEFVDGELVLSDETTWPSEVDILLNGGVRQHWEGSISNSYTVTKPATPTLSFTATPDIVEKGETTTLEWSSENTVSCTGTTHQEEYPVNVSQNVAPFIGGNLLIPVSNTFSAPSVVNNTPYYGFTNGITSGTVAKTLNYTTTYTVTCEGLNGEEVSASHTVTVDRPETTVSLSGPSTIERGQSANLSWNTENASVCYAEASPKNEKWGGLTTIENGGAPSYSPGFVGPRITTGPPVVYGLQLDDVNGSTLSSPVTEDTTFTINCRPSDNDTIAQVTDSITVTVTEPGEEDDPNNGSDPDGDTTPGPGGEGDFSISCTLPNGEDTTYPVNEDIVITITAPSIPSTYDFTITENGSYTPYTTSNTDSLTPAIKFLTTGTKNIEVTATNAEGVVDVCSFEDIVISVDPEFEEG